MQLGFQKYSVKMLYMYANNNIGVVCLGISEIVRWCIDTLGVFNLSHQLSNFSKNWWEYAGKTELNDLHKNFSQRHCNSVVSYDLNFYTEKFKML